MAFCFEIFIDDAGQFRFHPKGLNNEIIGDNYHQLQSAKHAVKLIKDGAATAPVYLVDAEGKRELIDV